jgi:hypothetical protein
VGYLGDEAYFNTLVGHRIYDGDEDKEEHEDEELFAYNDNNDK